jgi:hypothetical protein
MVLFSFVCHTTVFDAQRIMEIFSRSCYTISMLVVLGYVLLSIGAQYLTRTFAALDQACDGNKYSAGSEFQRNLKRVLYYLANNGSNFGFYTFQCEGNSGSNPLTIQLCLCNQWRFQIVMQCVRTQSIQSYLRFSIFFRSSLFYILHWNTKYSVIFKFLNIFSFFLFYISMGISFIFFLLIFFLILHLPLKYRLFFLLLHA